jgi:hypothetical protein
LRLRRVFGGASGLDLRGGGIRRSRLARARLGFFSVCRFFHRSP